MELFFRELGSGQPLIILHGLFGSCDNWLTVSKPLSEKFHVYLVDQRNHGRSPHHPVHTYSAMTDDLLEFIEKHQIQNSIVLGHSMGGKTAMHLALNHPKVLEKLIVADISPRYYTPHHQDVIAGLSAIDLDTLASREEADRIMSAHLPELGVRQFLLKNLYRDEQSRFSWRMNFEGLVSQIENIGEASTGNAFQKPTLFIKGALSRYIQDKDEELIHTLFPHSQTKTIEGAGHWVQAEKPQAFLDTVLAFL
jgi:esterase